MAGRFRQRKPELAGFMGSEHDALVCMCFPAQHRITLHSTNQLEQLNKEVKRRAGVAGIYMQIEVMSECNAKLLEIPPRAE